MGTWPPFSIPQLSTRGRELLRGTGLPEGMPHSGMTVVSSITKQALKNCSFTLSLKLFYKGAVLFIELQTMTKMFLACY